MVDNLDKNLLKNFEKNNDVSIKKLFQCVFDNVKNLNDKQIKEFEKDIDSFLQPLSRGGKISKKKSRKIKRTQKTKKIKRKSRKIKIKRKTKRKSQKYFYGGEGEDEGKGEDEDSICLICQNNITEEEKENSIEINQLPNNNNVLPRETIINHRCNPNKIVYYHGGCLSDWFRRQNTQRQCLNCHINFTNEEINSILEKFPPPPGYVNVIDNIDNENQVNDPLLILLILEARNLEAYVDDIFRDNRVPTHEDIIELNRRKYIVLNLFNMLRRGLLNGLRRYLFLFIRACHLGRFLNPQEEAFILDILTTMNEIQAFIALVICFLITLVILYYFSMQNGNQLNGGNGKEQIMNEKEQVDFLKKILNKLIEYNKYGDTEEIKKFLDFLQKI
jgi:hypothetical protein